MSDESSDARFTKWKEDVLSTNMLTVLSAIDQIAHDGGWRDLGLLTVAGDNVTGLAKRLSVSTPDGKKGFEEFRREAITRLKTRLSGTSPTPGNRERAPRVFVSYNHKDRERANALAVEFSTVQADVFLDHWDMAPHERILPRIEKELGASDVVIALISNNSIHSQWVQIELESVVRRQEAAGSVLLLPVLLDDCALPEIIRERRFYDLRDSRMQPEIVQTLVNQILGIKPFSQRVRDFLATPEADSPYERNALSRGRLLMQQTAGFRDIEISRNQKWLLWELFHNPS